VIAKYVEMIRDDVRDGVMVKMIEMSKQNLNCAFDPRVRAQEGWDISAHIGKKRDDIFFPIPTHHSPFWKRLPGNIWIHKEHGIS